MSDIQIIGDPSPHPSTSSGEPKPKPVGVLDLPFDILHLIFDEFRTTTDTWHKERVSRRQTIHALREVCQRFCTATTPFLFDTVTIRLDDSSSRRAETLLTQNPLLAASVRHVVVSLACRDPVQARDLAAFARAREEDLRLMLCWYDGWWKDSLYGRDKEARGEVFGVVNEDDPFESRLDRGERDWFSPEAAECFRNYHRIVNAWKGIREGQPSESTREDGGGSGDEGQGTYAAVGGRPVGGETERDRALRNYRQLLREAHELYGQRYQEQLEFIESGSFPQTVGRCLAKMRREGLHLTITHEPALRLLDGSGQPHDAAWCINDNERLLWVFTTPHYWCYFTKDPSEGMVVPAARLLTEIPVACYQAGATLTNLTIKCFPAAGRYSDLFPLSPKMPSLQDWATELHAACQQLEVFNFNNHGGKVLQEPAEHASALDGVYIDTFLSAMVAGPKLEDITLCMASFTFTVAGDAVDDQGNYDLGPVLVAAAGHWAHVRKLFLTGFCMTQQDLETIYRRLAVGALERFDFGGVRLRRLSDGGESSWAGALDILREKLFRRPGGKPACKVNFGFISGGEIDGICAEVERRRPEQDVIDDWIQGKICPFKMGIQCHIETLAWCYVLGDARVAENPFRGDRERLYARITNEKEMDQLR
ncbi:3-ketoacyl-CoA reductase [Apiospora rasikravindrae]|uniref:3-ketoacyl-CoA reductase n=1 Tax=Apiospora rasikravindrae TaxID=990691 RepID=A0ABR1RR42_9PEZI